MVFDGVDSDACLPCQIRPGIFVLAINIASSVPIGRETTSIVRRLPECDVGERVHPCMTGYNLPNDC